MTPLQISATKMCRVYLSGQSLVHIRVKIVKGWVSVGCPELKNFGTIVTRIYKAGVGTITFRAFQGLWSQAGFRRVNPTKQTKPNRAQGIVDSLRVALH